MIAAAALLRSRQMRRRDLKRVMEIERGSYAYPWTEGVFKDCMRVGYHCRIALDTGNRIVGYGLLSIAVDDAHILNLCVDSARRREGAGRYLLAHLTDLAERAYMRSILLEVRPSNAAALTLYRSAGYRQLGLRKNYYRSAAGREDALLLARRLNPPET